MLSTVTTSKPNWPEAIDKAFAVPDTAAITQLGFLVDGFHQVEPRLRSLAMEHLCATLENDVASAAKVGEAVCEVVRNADVTLLLTESGIPGNKGFFSELLGRIERRVLPDPVDGEDLRASLHQLFDRHDDHLWVEAIPDSLWIRLMVAIGIGEDGRPAVSDEWAASIRILSHHIASLGLQPEITHRLTHLDDANSPFLMLSDHVLCFIKAVRRENEDEQMQHCLSVALSTTQMCRVQVEKLREEKRLYGTSLRLTNLSFRLLQLLNRLENLLKLTAADKDAFRSELVLLFKTLVEAESRRDHIRPHIKKSGDLLAFQVVEHAAKKGSKYITTGRKDYWKFFAASLGGGFIVAIFALLKLLLKQPALPLGVEAFLFGVNYSVCFVVIYLTGSALATKQPAMTANTLARSLERDEEGLHLERLENLIVQVSRSQFISFVGNLMMALPLAFLLSIAYFKLTGTHVLDDATSTKILHGISPLSSGALIYAAIAGIFLFVSGLVAGWVDNRNLYKRYPQRIASHPFLLRLMGDVRAKKIGAFWDRNLGILAGNVVLGFCLGSTATLGEIIGLPIDIRHIAFSSAEYGMSLEALGSATPRELIVNASAGVILIGLVNFLVSFGLSLVMALESRAVRFQETRSLVWHLIRRLFRRPIDWFFPPRQ
ncbi:MAG: hypothetical protein AAF564_12760 [Bacteroidota bacterium]